MEKKFMGEDIEYDPYEEERGIEINFVYKPLLTDHYTKLMDVIMIGTFGHASTFLSIKLDDKAKKIGSFCNSERKMVSMADVYLIEERLTMIVIFNEAVHDIAYTNFSREFFKHFQGKHIVILDGMHYTKYYPIQMNSNEKFPKLFYISTTRSYENKKEMESVAKRLGNGRVVSGIAGDIMTYCELRGLSAELYLQVYQEYDIGLNDIITFDIFNDKDLGLNKVIVSAEIKSKIAQINKKLYSKNLYL